MNRWFITSWLTFLAGASQMLAQGVVSPFNGLAVTIRADTSYSLLVSGHFYGASTSNSGMPASTLIGSIDRINALGADLFISTGDLFINAKEDLSRYRSALFDRLKTPLVNAVGNHDMDGGTYHALFGPTYGSIDLGRDRTIILDTEKDDGRISGEQLALLELAASDAEHGTIRNLFIASHRPIWAEGDARYDGLFRNNTRSILDAGFGDHVLPILQRIAMHSKVYWFSGSLGGQAPFSVFYDEPMPGIHYIQSAIRDELKDAVLLVKVDLNEVDLEVISITSDQRWPIERFDLDRWRNAVGKAPEFNWRLLPYKIKTALTHWAFWSGVVSTLILLLLLRICIRRLA